MTHDHHHDRSEQTAPATDGTVGTGLPVTAPSAHAWYALGMLTVVYVFNFVDRQILSILNEDIKADLGLTDAHMGFLFGTAFAVCYAIFGIPLGRLADVWVRKRIIALGIAFWSLMTALSGTARGFGSLAAYRTFVGIGEASSGPAAISLLGDYFPPRLRATAIAVYSSGVYLGMGLGMLIGGHVVSRWNAAYPVAAAAPFGLAGWQVAFFAVGLPGILCAWWVARLTEPQRGAGEGLPQHGATGAPLAVLGAELAAVVPPLTLLSLLRRGGRRALFANLALATVCALAAWLLARAFGSPEQWIALNLGLYAFGSWLQGLNRRDPATFAMIFGCRTMMCAMPGFACCAFVTYAGGYWTAPYFLRVHGVDTATAGTVLGLTAMVAGWLGVTLGGVVSDRMKRHTPRARIHGGLITVLLAAPAGLVLFTTSSLQVAYVANFFFVLGSASWIGPAVALYNELVLPRMRATVSAIYILMGTFIGLALGPFGVGRISTTLTAQGMDPGEALRIGLLCALGVYAVTVSCMLLAWPSIARDEASRLARARALGEAV
jgi:MFS family permease